MLPNPTELANPLTPSTHFIHSLILYPKIYFTYRIKALKKEDVKLFFENLDFPLNALILKDIINLFLMAEFQYAKILNKFR